MIHTFWHKYVMSDRSETIAFARIQMFIGAVWTVLAVADKLKDEVRLKHRWG